MFAKLTYLVVVIAVTIHLTCGFSALEDVSNIRRYQRSVSVVSKPQRNPALVARRLVHQATWAAVGTISTNDVIKGFPMVNIISVNDNNAKGQSTGRIEFLLTDLDYTGPDWQHNNKVTFLFTDEQQLHCSQHLPNAIDPMEPICARVIISGRIHKLAENTKEYKQSIEAFIVRHPAAKKWIKAHSFYLCEFEIENIFLMDAYGGPQTVNAVDYYNVQLE